MGRHSHSPSGEILASLKIVLELAQAGLTGIGVPGVEAIPAIPLKIISYFEVRLSPVTPHLTLTV